MLNQDKLYSSIALISKTCPLVFSILTKIQVKESKEVKTACILYNKKKKIFEILLGKDFIKDFDELNLAALLEHEILHLCFSHLDEDYNKNFKDHALANIVFDAIINENCLTMRDRKKLNSKIQEGIFYDKIRSTYKVDCEGKNSLEIYNEILQNQKEEKSNQEEEGEGQNGEGEGQGEEVELSNFDETLQESLSNSDKDSEEVKEAKTLIKNSIKNLSESEKKQIGNSRGELSRMISDILTEKFDAKKVLARAFQKSLRQCKKSTWKKTSRRYEEEKGKKKDKLPSVLLLVDTSGSMGEEVLSLIAFQCNELLKLSSLKVCWGDTALEGEENFKRGDKFKGEKLKGGGGTNLNFWADVKGKFDLVVFFTDGYIGKMEKTKQKMLFIIQKGGMKVDNHENIILE